MTATQSLPILPLRSHFWLIQRMSEDVRWSDCSNNNSISIPFTVQSLQFWTPCNAINITKIAQCQLRTRSAYYVLITIMLVHLFHFIVIPSVRLCVLLFKKFPITITLIYLFHFVISSVGLCPLTVSDSRSHQFMASITNDTLCIIFESICIR